MEWIKIEVRLPAPWTPCLVLCKGRYAQPEGMFTAESIHMDKVDKSVRGVDKYLKLLLYITHWMPLPPAPKK